MSLDMAAIRAGLKTNLKTIAGLNVYEKVPDQLYCPCVLVGYMPGDLVRMNTFGPASRTVRLVAQVYVAESSGAVDAQTALDPYISDNTTKSIETAIYTDRKLGGACSDIEVSVIRNEGQYEYAGVNYLGCEFVLDIIT